MTDVIKERERHFHNGKRVLAVSLVILKRNAMETRAGPIQNLLQCHFGTEQEKRQSIYSEL